MELKGITMPGYRVYEYLLVLNPHEELRSRIMEVRKEFSKEYHLTSERGGKPNLPLVHFLNYEMMEGRILNRLKAIALGFPPFKVELKNFGSFPTHTIYINVTSKMPIQGLVKEIRTQTQRLMTINDETKPYFILEPHITIGRKLKPWQYEKGWLEYSGKHFTGRFIADAMLLLKRQSKESPWMVAERFQFQNMPVATKQGELFG
jgi:2'-5' RNA ligase